MCSCSPLFPSFSLHIPPSPPPPPPSPPPPGTCRSLRHIAHVRHTVIPRLEHMGAAPPSVAPTLPGYVIHIARLLQFAQHLHGVAD
eukprot:8476629-Pyramimonas_sp.AAC.1